MQETRDSGSIPGSGRSPGGGHGNPLQYSCLENPMDRGPGGLSSIGLQRLGHDWCDLSIHARYQADAWVLSKGLTWRSKELLLCNAFPTWFFPCKKNVKKKHFKNHNNKTHRRKSSLPCTSPLTSLCTSRPSKRNSGGNTTQICTFPVCDRKF